MKKTSTIIILLIAGIVSCRAQSDTSFRLLRSIKGDIAAFTVDNLDNIYILSSTNQVKKLNGNGDSVAVFNDVKKFGQASLIDVSNPLKLLLFYKDFLTIVVLDRLLTVRTIIDLRKRNILQVQAIGQSYDNKIWVYDEVENKLRKINDDGSLLMETADFRQLFDEAPSPQKIFDQDKYVYLYDSAKAVYTFDYFGALKNKILISRWQNFKVAGKFIFGSLNNILYRYDISTFRTDEWRMPEEIYKSRAFNFTASRLYALKKDVIEVYSFR